MQNVTDGERQGLQWSLTSTLEDLDYADDIGLLSNRHQKDETHAKKHLKQQSSHHQWEPH